MARNKRTTRRTTVQNQQQLHVELHNNSVLALAAPPLPPSPPPLTPSPKVVAGGSSPDKFEDFEDEEVDYSASGEYPSSFHSPLPTSTGKIVDINPNSASRVSPISESGHSVTPEPSLQIGDPHRCLLSNNSPLAAMGLPIISQSSWKCDATLSIHESGWLVYKFKNIDDKLAVLANGPYLIYGRPLILKAMPEYFSFGKDEMACVPVWVKFPNLPLKCLVTTFCTLCKVLGHKTGACTPPPKPVVARPVDKQNHPATSTNKDRSVFNRLGPVDGQISEARKQGTPPAFPNQNNAMGNKGSSQSSQQPLDPLQAEVEAVSGGWEVVKGKKSNSSHKETPITATHQRITSKDKENISNEGTTGSNVVLLRTEKQSREDISVGCNVRTGETVGNEITQKAAPPASPGVVTRSNTRKSGGSGRRPPTSPAGK
ncbi:hypothetical protein NC651_034584 [Populus alba x Populus x berolinensis]|nr:hypothetical protein NC651_034584 [Populus alba x Populus x berolinensis]